MQIKQDPDAAPKRPRTVMPPIVLGSDDDFSPEAKGSRGQGAEEHGVAAATMSGASNQFQRYSAGDGWQQRRSADAGKRT
jgi:hypothetical protein